MSIPQEVSKNSRFRRERDQPPELRPRVIGFVQKLKTYQGYGQLGNIFRDSSSRSGNIPSLWMHQEMLYTTGKLPRNSRFRSGIRGTANLTSAGQQDVYSKVTLPLILFWAKIFWGNSIDAGNAITVDASRKCPTTTGHSLGTMFDRGVGQANLTSAEV